MPAEQLLDIAMSKFDPCRTASLFAPWPNANIRSNDRHLDGQIGRMEVDGSHQGGEHSRKIGKNQPFSGRLWMTLDTALEARAGIEPACKDLQSSA